MQEQPPQVPPAIAAPTGTPDSTAAPAELSERHKKYAEDFKQWLLGLNRHDFVQAKRVLEAMTKAYFKHTVKVHSPPARDEKNDTDVPGPTSVGTTGTNLPGAGEAPAQSNVVELRPKS